MNEEVKDPETLTVSSETEQPTEETPAEVEVPQIPEVQVAPPVPQEDNEPMSGEGWRIERAVDGWQVVIDAGTGSSQIYKARTQKEAIAALAKAQTHATRKIRQQERQIKLNKVTFVPEKAQPVPEFKSRNLTADEKFLVGSELSDPTKAAEALDKYFTAVYGPPEDYWATKRRVYEIEQMERDRTIAANWAAQNSEFNRYNTPENREHIKNYFANHNLAVTEQNLTYTFELLRDDGLLEPLQEKSALVQPAPAPAVQPAPAPAAAPPAAPVSGGRPRSASTTGISPRQSSVRSEPAKPATTVGPTAEEIERMPAAEYKRRLSDPHFVEHVNRLAQERKIRGI